MQAGDVLLLDRAASVQFTSPITFRVIRVEDAGTTDGWVWLDGYQLDERGNAVDKRSVFVQLSGVQHRRQAGR